MKNSNSRIEQPLVPLPAFLVLRQHYDKQGGQRAQEEGGEPPKQAAAILGLSQSGIDQRESAPAHEKLCVLHFSIPFFLICFLLDKHST